MTRKRSNHIRLVITIFLAALTVTSVLLVWTIHSRSVKTAESERAGTKQEYTDQAGGATEELTDNPGDFLQDGQNGTGGQNVLASVFFASDYQAEDGWPAPSENLAGILNAIISDGKRIDNAVFCGDYTNDRDLHDYQLSPEESISEIRSVVADEVGISSMRDEEESTDNDAMDTSANSTERNSDEYGKDELGDDASELFDPAGMIFIQGNHDRLTESISSSGLHEFDDYLVYVLNTENDFPWKQGKTAGCLAKVTRASQEMKECLDDLISRGETRPVFIAGHVPLHFTARTSSRHTTGDNLYSSLIFDVVNEAAGSLDIVYMTGHNHSKGWDCYMGGSSFFRMPGDTILIPEYDRLSVNSDNYREETLRFAYMNAGYVGYYMNCGTEELDNGTYGQYSAADETLTGTLCDITADEIIITRYSEDGVHQLGADGAADPYKGGIDTDLIPEKYYGRKVASPVRIARHEKPPAR